MGRIRWDVSSTITPHSRLEATERSYGWPTSIVEVKCIVRAMVEALHTLTFHRGTDKQI